MKVKELIAALQECDPEFEVILQKDGEGNGYSPAVGAEETHYEPDSTWSGECDSEEGEKNAVVIWPVN